MTRAFLEPHHDGSELFVAPGTPALGDVVPVRLRVPAGTRERAVHVRTVQDGEPLVTPARLDRETEHERWYVAEVTVHNPVAPYRFLLDVPGGYRWVDGVGVRDRDVRDAGDFRLTVHPAAPSWAPGSVVYQVFPDRFARSGVPRPVPDWAQPADWDDEPIASGPGVGTQWFGGDLLGIEQRLDHLEALGVDVLYLTPVFPGRSNHRYDASTFDHVDPVLGGDEAFASLSRAVHARGMRIMGDITTNHTGAAHEWFLRARTDPASEERSFYFFDDDGGYVGWLGHASLPKLDHSAPALGRRLVDGPGSVVGRWMAEPFSLDGWRVDVANMTGRYRDQDLTHEVARRVRATITAIRPDALLVSEHFHDASEDLVGDGWHANMNYNGFTRPMWTWLVAPGHERPMPGLPVSRPRRPGSAAVAVMRDFASAVPWGVTAAQWNILGSHDTARIRTLAGSRELVEVGAGLLLTYPGMPMIFAGDEVGATGTNGEHARVPMPWDRPDRWDSATFETYRSLIAVRRSSRALRHGGLRWVLAEDDAVGYLRETADERVLVVAARAPWSGATLPGWLAEGPPSTLHGPDLEVADGVLRVPGDGPAVGVWRLA